MNTINAKGFTISEPKSYLEAGTKKNVTITWTPPETHNVSYFFQLFYWFNTRSIPQCIVREFPSLLSQSVKAYWIFFLIINGNSSPGFHCWSAFNILYWGADDWEHFTHCTSTELRYLFVGEDKTCFKTLFIPLLYPLLFWSFYL